MCTLQARHPAPRPPDHLVVARHLRGLRVPRPIQRHIASCIGESFLTRWVREHRHFTSIRTYGIQEPQRVLESCCTRHEDLVSIVTLPWSTCITSSANFQVSPAW